MQRIALAALALVLLAVGFWAVGSDGPLVKPFEGTRSGEVTAVEPLSSEEAPLPKLPLNSKLTLEIASVPGGDGVGRSPLEIVQPLEVAQPRRIRVVAIVNQPVARVRGQTSVECAAGVTCEFGVVLDGADYPAGRLALREGRSDVAGRVEVEFEVPGDFLHGDQVQVYGRVVEPGYQRWVETVALGSGAYFELALTGSRGTTVTGTVVDGAGRPVEGARVAAWTAASGETNLKKVPLPRGHPAGDRYITNSNGRFAVTLVTDFDGQRFRLMATHTGRGLGSSSEFALTLRGSSPDLQITLEGDGVLAGQVVDMLGKPVADFDLWASHVETPLSVSWGVYIRAVEDGEGELDDPGLTSQRVTTDRQGRFDFQGLRPGLYYIRGLSPGNRHRYEMRSAPLTMPGLPTGDYDCLLTQQAVTTGDRELLLRAQRRVVVIHTYDANGKPLFVTEEFDPDGEPVDHGLFFREVDSAGKALPRFSGGSARTRGADGSLSFDVRVGATYSYGIVSKDAALVEGFITVDDHSWETHLTVQVGPKESAGTLRVELFDPEGARLGRGYGVVVSSPVTGVVLLAMGWPMSRWPALEASLAPGRYELRASDGNGTGSGGGGMVYNPDRFGPVVREAEVFAGQQTLVPIRLVGVGRFLVKVDVQDDPDFGRWPGPTASSSAVEVDFPPIDVNKAGAAWPPQAWIHMRRVGDVDGETIKPFSRFPTNHDMGRRYSTVAAGGAPEVAQPVSVGEYILIGIVPGYRPFEQRITITADKTPSVLMTFRGAE